MKTFLAILETKTEAQEAYIDYSQQRSGGCQTRGSGGGGGSHGRPGDLILSPIEDVSPSLEAAEQESMSRIQVGVQSLLVN